MKMMMMMVMMMNMMMMKMLIIINQGCFEAGSKHVKAGQQGEVEKTQSRGDAKVGFDENDENDVDVQLKDWFT